MPDLLAHETDLYTGIWAGVPSYGDHAPGEHYLPIFLDCVGDRRGRLTSSKGSVLDAGTGSGKGALALHRLGFRVTACDLTDAGLTDEARETLRFRSACLWHDLRPLAPLWQSFDWVYCTDVLEHLPPQFTMLAVSRLLEVTSLGLFLAVYLEQDSNGAWVGQPLHLTVQPFTWWRDNLKELAEVVDARDLHQAATFFLKPRR
jgi:SAM-dependent methyltransferase